jgi:two-component system sensor histidine kinase MtrB
MRTGLVPQRLRARIVTGFAAGALLVSAVLVTTTFGLARSYLVDQREQSLVREAYADANLLRSRLSGAGADVTAQLGDLVPSVAGDVLVRRGDAWYSSSLDADARDVPPELARMVADGSAGSVRVAGPTGPRLVVGVPVREAGVDFFEVSELTELQQVLHTLTAVLAAGAAAATTAGALFGWWASRRVVQPLEEVGAVAGRISAGELTSRLPATTDPDLAGIVGSFNAMVDTLAERLERDARFVGDVSHELRSPLTSLVTSVEVMATRRADMPVRSQQALALVESELDRFRHMLDDLLELARLEQAPDAAPGARFSLGALVREVLLRAGRPAGLLHTGPEEETVVVGDKLRLERAVTNLLQNADRHAGGPTRVHVARTGDTVVVTVADAGPGVPPADRQRVFERFARGPSATRGSLPGAGLGLAITADIAAQHGGAAWCSPGPVGARFSLSVPSADR